MTDAPLPRATIVRREDVTGDLFVLWLKPEVQFTFKVASTSRSA